MIAAPVKTMVEASEFTTMATEATPRTRIAMTEDADLAAAGAVVVVRVSPAPANAPPDRAPSQPALPHRPAPRKRAATGAAARAGRPTGAASPTGDSPHPVVPRIADRPPLAAMDAPPHNLSPSPKADAVAASVAASAVPPGIVSLDTCKTPPSRPGMSWGNWSQ